MILVSVAVFILIGVGLYVSKKVQGDSTNYIVAGRGLILPLAAATLMAQAVDTNATLGNTDLTAEFGFWAGAALPIGLALALFMTGLFFAKPLNRMNLMTLPEFYRRRYGRSVELIASIIMVLSFSILLAGNMVAAGFLFEVFLGTSYLVRVFIIAGILLLYTMPGGLFSVVYTDIIQVGVALVGSLALIGFVFFEFGSGSIFKQLGIEPNGPVLYELLREAAPAVLVVIVLAGIVAASLSTGDGAILGTPAVCARNIFGIGEGEEERSKLLRTTRIIMVPITILGLFFAIRVPETGVLLTLAFDVAFAGLLVPLTLGLFWSKANTPSALAAIIFGSGTRLVLFALTPTVYGVKNTLLYIPNDLISASFDGLPTLISPLVGLGIFVLMALSTQDTYAPAALNRRWSSGRNGVEVGEMALTRVMLCD